MKPASKPKDPFDLAVAARINAAMKESSIPTSAELARRMKKEHPRVRNWTNGTQSPPLNEGIELREFFGVTLDWLYLGDWRGLIERKRIRLTAILAGNEPPAWAAEGAADIPAVQEGAASAEGPASLRHGSARASVRTKTSSKSSPDVNTP